MNISAETIESLLYESESTTLDFKRDQYLFENASDDEKGELLKDILAFANSWRRTDAYILIGVDEVQSGRSNIVGVAQHLDDAKLQQFVNTKTQRPLHFAYYVVPFEGKSLGVIHIPPQERPIYLKSNYGKLTKATVYLRRGSSTAIADPDEIAKMGPPSSATIHNLPILKAEFFDSEKLTNLGDHIEVTTINIDLPKHYEFPDYGRKYVNTGFGGGFEIPAFNVNHDYWRDLAKELQFLLGYTCVDFIVTNTGDCVANDVRIAIEIHDPSETIMLADTNNKPVEPSKSAIILPALHIKSETSVKHVGGKWLAQIFLGKIQPKSQAHSTNGLYIGSRNNQTVTLKTTIRADNLPIPTEGELFVEFETSKQSFGVDELMRKFKKQEDDAIKARLKELGGD